MMPAPDTVDLSIDDLTVVARELSKRLAEAHEILQMDTSLLAEADSIMREMSERRDIENAASFGLGVVGTLLVLAIAVMLRAWGGP